MSELMAVEYDVTLDEALERLREFLGGEHLSGSP